MLGDFPTKAQLDRLFPIGTLLPYYGKKPRFLTWRICNGKNGTVDLRSKMNGKTIAQFIQRVK